MSKTIIALKIDVSKIDKERLFKGEKGTYLDAVLFLDADADLYGQNGMITQSVTKEEREAGTKGPILGNAKIIGGLATQNDTKPQGGNAASADDSSGDLPF